MFEPPFLAGSFQPVGVSAHIQYRTAEGQTVNQGSYHCGMLLPEIASVLIQTLPDKSYRILSQYGGFPAVVLALPGDADAVPVFPDGVAGDAQHRRICRWLIPSKRILRLCLTIPTVITTFALPLYSLRYDRSSFPVAQ